MKNIQWNLTLAAVLVLAVAFTTMAGTAVTPSGDAKLAASVRVIDEYQTPGLESELSGIYAHPSNDDLYYVLANLKPPSRYGQQPMLPAEYRGKLLTVN